MTGATAPGETEITAPGQAPAAAIILAGGRASRLDGAAKPLLEVGGRTLLDRAIEAVDTCHTIVVVGPAAPTHRHVVWTRETPEFGGPVAGIAAGLALVDSTEVYVLAADLPNAEEAVGLLRQHPALSDDEDGVCLADAAGRMQWLIGRYRTDALRAAVTGLPDGGRDASIRALLAPLRITAIPGEDLATDVDTWDDLERARATIHTHGRDERTGRGDDMTDAPKHLPVEALDDWTSAVCAALELDRESVDVALLLDLARDVAHGVARPAAPLSAYLAGLAAGRAGGSRDDTEEAVATITELAASWRAGETRS